MRDVLKELIGGKREKGPTRKQEEHIERIKDIRELEHFEGSVVDFIHRINGELYDIYYWVDSNKEKADCIIELGRIVGVFRLKGEVDKTITEEERMQVEKFATELLLSALQLQAMETLGVKRI